MAEREIDAVVHYLSLSADVELGERFYAAFGATADQLAERPWIGSRRPHLSRRFADLRSWRVTGFESYRIYYRPVLAGVEVLHVLHAARDSRRVFRRPRRG